MTSTPVKKPIARNSLFIFNNILDVKKKPAIRWVRDAKSKRKAIEYLEMHNMGIETKAKSKLKNQ